MSPLEVAIFYVTGAMSTQPTASDVQAAEQGWLE